MKKVLAMPEFKQGLNIKIEPENFNLDNLDLADSGIDREKFKEFFSEEFLNSQTKIDEVNEKFGKIIFIEVKKDGTLEKEIDFNEEKSSANYVLVKAGKNSKLKLIAHSKCGGNYFAQDVRVIAEENSEVEVITIQNLDEKTNNFSKRTSVGAKNSKVKFIEICLGSAYTRLETNSFLNGVCANGGSEILFSSKNSQRFDLFTSSFHNSKETSSKLITRGILGGKSKVLSRGLIKISKKAPESKGVERQDSLILSEDAEADAIPKLEINNNEVECNHGSTIGKIDSSKLFYLMSRGLNKKEAQRKIIEGYFASILGKLENEKIINEINLDIDKSLK